MINQLLRRSFDFVVATTVLLVTTPLLILVIIAIRFESKGSPIFTQLRIGKDGHPFHVYKLRTMVQGAQQIGAGLAVDQNDERITRVGAFLRRFSIDELPNFVNVLRGEMAVIGPRPTVKEQVERYSEHQRKRLRIKPGMTGWAQVHGRASLPWEERIELDIWYIEHRSWRRDLDILARTIKVVFQGEGVYRGPRGGWKEP